MASSTVSFRPSRIGVALRPIETHPSRKPTILWVLSQNGIAAE